MRLKKRGIILLLLVLANASLVLGATTPLQTLSASTEKKGTNMKKYQENEIIFSTASYYRKFISIAPNGYFKIQEFYAHNDLPFSAPYLVKLESDLTIDNFQQQSIEGQYIHYGRNGEVTTVTYQSGKKEGLQIKRDIQGNLLEQTEFHNNKENGSFLAWYPNANKYAEGMFINGKDEGTFTVWYENGQKKSQNTMKDGEINGLFTFWYINGQKKSEGFTTDGKNTGIWKSWYENGQVSSEVEFDLGAIKSCSAFDEQGKVIHFNENNQEFCLKIFRKFFTTSLETVAPL